MFGFQASKLWPSMDWVDAMFAQLSIALTLYSEQESGKHRVLPARRLVQLGLRPPADMTPLVDTCWPVAIASHVSPLMTWYGFLQRGLGVAVGLSVSVAERIAYGGGEVKA